MHRTDAKKIAIALLGAFVLAGALLAVLAFVNVDGGVIAGTSSETLGWIVPIVAGAVIGAVAFLLLDDGSRAEGGERELRPSTCRACGSDTIAEWRICPHCGEILDREVGVAAGCSSSETA
jgi:hypothetical protein